MHRWSYIWEDTENRVISHTPFHASVTGRTKNIVKIFLLFVDIWVSEWVVVV